MTGISVIIPTFNRENFIDETIQSVINQDYDGKVEVIISDDGSTDRTLEIARSYGERVKILRKPAGCLNQGASSTRNRGIIASSQPYLCFLDSDDFFLPGHISKSVSFMDLNPDKGFVFCRVLENSEQNDSHVFSQWTKKRITPKNILYPIVSGNNIVCTNSFVFQRYVFDKVGVFDETFSNGEDADMWLRISEQFRGGFSDHFGVVRRKHGINQLTFNPSKIIRLNHFKVYMNAIDRCNKSGHKNLYCNIKLQMRVFKYRLYGLKVLNFFEHAFISAKYLSRSLRTDQRFIIRKSIKSRKIDCNELLNFYEMADLDVRYILNASRGWEETPGISHQLTFELAKNFKVVFIAASKTGVPRIDFINYQNNILVIQPYFMFNQKIRSRLPVISGIYQSWLFPKLRKKFGDAYVLNFDPESSSLKRSFIKVHNINKENYSAFYRNLNFLLV